MNLSHFFRKKKQFKLDSFIKRYSFEPTNLHTAFILFSHQQQNCDEKDNNSFDFKIFISNLKILFFKIFSFSKYFLNSLLYSVTYIKLISLSLLLMLQTKQAWGKKNNIKLVITRLLLLSWPSALTVNQQAEGKSISPIKNK